MTDDIEKLKRDYRAIRAPAQVATGIREQLADEPRKGGYWMPATASALTVIAIVGVLPFLLQPQPGQPASEKPTKPSLSALASMVPKKPTTGTTTSMTQLRSVKVPKMPAKPKAARPQAHSPIENELLKENDHALI